MLIGIDASRAITEQRTGTEAYAHYLIKTLIPLAQERNHQIRLYFNQPPSSSTFPTHVEQRIIPFPRLWTHIRLGYELYQSPPDIFFTPAHVIPYHYKGNSIATIHDLGYHHFPEAHPPKQRRLLEWGTRLNATKSKAIIADSETTKKDLLDLYQIDDQKITVIYPGPPPVPNKVNKPKRERILNKYNIKAPYFFYIGTIQPRKNIMRMINAYQIVSEKEEVDLVLAGKLGWYGKQILTHIEQLPESIQKRIHLIGFIQEEEKSAFLTEAVALLFPSLYEGFGFPVLEAQQMDCPVITANSSSLPEVAGRGALFVNPLQTEEIATAMSYLLRNQTARTELTIHGKENLKRFSWEKTATEILNLLETAGQNG